MPMFDYDFSDRWPGVVFCDIGTARRDHRRLVDEFLGTLVSVDGDAFAEGDATALDDAVVHDGSFIYVPPGIQVEMPLQVDARTNAQRVGPIDRTLVIAAEGSRLHFIDGCAAPVYTRSSQRSSVVEIVVKSDADVTYSGIQNWTSNVRSVVTKLAEVGAGARLRWTDGSIGSASTSTNSSVRLRGEGAIVDFFSIACAVAAQRVRATVGVVHTAAHTRSAITAASICARGGVVATDWSVDVEHGAVGAASDVACDALLLDDESTASTTASVEANEWDAQIERHGTSSRISDEQRFYLMSRGMSDDESVALVVDGFIEPVTRSLPVEYAVEWSRLIDMHLSDTSA